MRNYFFLDGVDSRTYGIYMSGSGLFSSPARAYETIPIPGRNGDLIAPEKRFLNGSFVVPCFIYANMSSSLEAFRSFINSLFGYKTFSSTYDTTHFREVILRESFDPVVSPRFDVVSFDLSFEAKPQRFLNSGNTVTTLNASGSITNPTRFESQPLLRVYGSGQLGIGSQTITISAANTYTDIDCEMGDAFKGTDNRNLYVTLSGHNFPTLKPGANNFSFSSGITRVDITPRWFEI